MLKIIAGGAVAALIMLAAPGAASAASAVDKSSPMAGQTAGNGQVTEFSDQRRRRYVRRYYRPRYVRPYYYPYAYRPYYNPYRSYGYYGYPYRRPGIYFGFGF